MALIGSSVTRRRVIACGLIAALWGLRPKVGFASSPEAPRALRGLKMFSPPLPLPDMYLQSAEGEEQTIRAFGPGSCILNLWATWCAPCVEELPSLQRLSLLAKGRFRVILLSQDRGGSAVTDPFLRRLGVTDLPVFADPSGRFGRALSVRGLPTTFIINQHGSIVGRYEGGARWDDGAVVEFISTLSAFSPS